LGKDPKQEELSRTENILFVPAEKGRKGVEPFPLWVSRGEGVKCKEKQRN